MIVAAAYVRVSTDEQTDYSPPLSWRILKNTPPTTAIISPKNLFLWTRAFPANAPISVLHFKP